MQLVGRDNMRGCVARPAHQSTTPPCAQDVSASESNRVVEQIEMAIQLPKDGPWKRDGKETTTSGLKAIPVSRPRWVVDEPLRNLG
jgi:hypothetical protein